jgi:hypothetical protein
MKQLTRRADIPAFLQQQALNNRICEVGVRFGYNLMSLLACNPTVLIGIDHYSAGNNKAEQDTGLSQDKLDSIYREVVQRYIHFPAVKIIKDRSDKTSALFKEQWFDYMYLDADHSYGGCLNDMQWWWPKVRQGGIMAGHDYIETTSKQGTKFGVIEAVRQFMSDKKIPEHLLHVTNEGYKTWMLYRQEGE